MLMPMKNTLPAVLLFLLALSAFSAFPAYPFEGPLQVKNQYPIFIHAHQPYLEKASMENSLLFSLSHSSTYTVQNSEHWDINLDMEITEMNLRYKRIIKDYIELNIDLPVLIFGSGFMDGFLDWYHDAFGLSDYGRSARPLHNFLYEVKRDDTLVIRGRSGAGLGDIRLALKKPFLSTNGLRLSAAGSIELPTGNTRRGFSNGSLDAGIAILIDKRFFNFIMTHWNIGAVFPGDVRGYEIVELKNFIYGGTAIEAVFGKGLSVLVQLQGQSVIYPETDLLAVDREAYLFVVGGRYKIKNRNSFELSLAEDINTAGAPDFIVNVTYKIML
jgi:hypothetical protein